MSSAAIYKFKTVGLAGTFDRLHKGHKFFISEAFKLGEKAVIGLTSDKFANRKIRNPKSEIRKNIKIQNFQIRKKGLEELLREEGLLGRVEIVKIEDVYGPAISDTEIEALVVTDETSEGANKVNKKRKEIGLKPLKIIEVPLILAQDKKRIASTRIRLGEIDRFGRLFASRINEGLRQELKKPLGLLISGKQDNLHTIAGKLNKAVAKTNSSIIITVGDEVTKLCNEIGVVINLAIVDFKVQRKEKYRSLSELGFENRKKIKTPRGWQAERSKAMTPPMVEGTVNNPPGHITKELVKAVKNAYSGIIKDGKQRIVQVDGEEDLAGVPAVLLAPLGSVVLYGQPDKGIVAVQVTEKKKEELLKLIQKNI